MLSFKDAQLIHQTSLSHLTCKIGPCWAFYYYKHIVAIINHSGDFDEIIMGLYFSCLFVFVY